MTITERDVTNVLIVIFLVEIAVATLWALPGILRDFRRENGWQSPLFLAVVSMDVIGVIVCLAFVPPSLDALGVVEFDFPFLGSAIVLGIMLLAGAVIVHRIAFESVKRRRGHVSDTASGEEVKEISDERSRAEGS